MKKNLKDYKKDFLLFLNNIESNLSKASKILNVDELTFSYDEIDSFKEVYEANYMRPEAIGVSTFELDEIFDSYVGEAFMHYNRGHWELCVLKKDDAYGRPIIMDWGKDNFPHARISPYVWRIRIQRKKFKETISEKIRAAQIPFE